MYSISGFNTTQAYYHSLINESQKKIVAGYNKRHRLSQPAKVTTSIEKEEDKLKLPSTSKSEPKSKAPHRIDDSVFNPTNGFLSPGVSAKLNLSNVIGIDPKSRDNKTTVAFENNDTPRETVNDSKSNDTNDMESRVPDDKDITQNMEVTAVDENNEKEMVEKVLDEDGISKDETTDDEEEKKNESNDTLDSTRKITFSDMETSKDEITAPAEPVRERQKNVITKPVDDNKGNLASNRPNTQQAIKDRKLAALMAIQSEEINWKRRFTNSSKIPNSTKEVKPDLVTLRLNTPRYEFKKADWQEIGRIWERNQSRTSRNTSGNTPFCSESPRSYQIPGYSGHISGYADRDDAAVTFSPRSLVRSQPTTPHGRTTRPFPKSSSESPEFGHQAPMSSMITLTSPHNPFNRIDREPFLQSAMFVRKLHQSPPRVERLVLE
ncbi:uncharacterized protein TRIADDRAFT_54997 [Trichoplax adhaerens]|uniref:Uncharacterized protein n=1 Tax=Trichoplax adhaerens TaxID=10228 RepID=B3RQI0_TRIAD|nr:hypothetical protein TRIADDRAFT_54997 [Trichoplax adhaerens]EDV26700.1 hypothetical protein TRIADDRAFT_54997 [Trichoplax adhaerens]|eukprot:XP_002110696.1 hypothetical protein TRIADDRAFT_54997 [Trichoplax adhaerens]